MIAYLAEERVSVTIEHSSVEKTTRRKCGTVDTQPSATTSKRKSHFRSLKNSRKSLRIGVRYDGDTPPVGTKLHGASHAAQEGMLDG